MLWHSAVKWRIRLPALQIAHFQIDPEKSQPGAKLTVEESAAPTVTELKMPYLGDGAWDADILKVMGVGGRRDRGRAGPLSRSRPTRQPSRSRPTWPAKCSRSWSRPGQADQQRTGHSFHRRRPGRGRRPPNPIPRPQHRIHQGPASPPDRPAPATVAPPRLHPRRRRRCRRRSSPARARSLPRPACVPWRAKIGVDIYQVARLRPSPGGSPPDDV